MIGQSAETIARAVRAVADSNIRVEFGSSMAEAVDRAGKITKAGDVILLSPACASYDMFDNYRQRGETFAALVKKLQ